MQFKTENGKRFYWLVTVSLFLLSFTPLIVSRSTIFQFEVGKGIAIRILIEIALLFYFWFWFSERRLNSKISLLSWAVIFYLAVLIITVLTSINPYRSFWGGLERMEGVFTIFHAGVLFFILTNIRWGEKLWFLFFSFSVGVSILVGMSELLSDKPVFFGNPAFLAVYGLFNTFFASIVLVKSGSWGSRILAFIGFFINLAVLFSAANRGVIVGLGLGILVMTALFFFLHSKRIIRFAAFGVLLLLIFSVGFIFLIRNEPQMERFPYLIQKFANIGGQDTSLQTRLIALGVSLDAFKERPLFGWGPEQFQVAYNKYFNPRYLTYEQAWFDRAHNKIAEVGVTQGVVGLMSYIFLFFIAIFSFVPLLKKQTFNKKTQLVLVILLGLMAAYFTENLFLFDTPISYVMFFSSLAFIDFCTRAQEVERIKKNNQHRANSAVSVVLLIVMSVIGISLIFGPNLKTLRAAQLTRRGVVSVAPRDAYTEFSTALMKGGYARSDVLKQASKFLLDARHARSLEWEEVFNLVSDNVEDFLKKEPHDAQLTLLLGRLYAERSLIREELKSKAETVLKRAITLAPERPEPYMELGFAQLDNNTDEAFRFFQQAIDLNPLNPAAHWRYGLALIAVQKNDIGLKEIEDAIQLGYDWHGVPFEIENLINVYTSLNRYDKLIGVYDTLAHRYPHNVEYWFSLAQTYASVGDKTKALEVARDALQIDSTNSRMIEDFIFDLVKQ